LYEIIIPQEKPKQDSNKTHHLDELPNVDKDVVSKMYNAAIPKLEPKQDYKPNSCDIIFETAALIENKQETLEEAAEFWDAKQTILEFEKSSNRPFKKAFEQGAKWQEQRIPSIIEEYLETAFISNEQGYMNPKEWLEQFKKI
jgi:hypothetical protein